MSATLQPTLEVVEVYIDDQIGGNFIGGRVYILMGDGRDSVTNNVNAWLSEGAYNELDQNYNSDELDDAIQKLIEQADSMVYARTKKPKSPKAINGDTVPDTTNGSVCQLTFGF